MRSNKHKQIYSVYKCNICNRFHNGLYLNGLKNMYKSDDFYFYTYSLSSAHRRLTRRTTRGVHCARGEWNNESREKEREKERDENDTRTIECAEEVWTEGYSGDGRRWR